jgi:uncharacterized protein
MSKLTRSLDNIKMVSPCEADWDSMIGNDQVRFCEHCKLHVTDLSAMTRPDAMRLVARSKGRLCVRYFPRPGGGVLTKDLPAKLHRISRRVSRLAAGAFTATLSVSSAAGQSQSRLSAPREVTVLAQKFEAQEVSDPNTASLSGTVADPNGAVIPGAQIVLVDNTNNSESSTTSSSEGQFEFKNLSAGTYVLKITPPEPIFKALEIRDIQLRAGANQQVPATLEIGGSTAVCGGVGFSEPEDPLVKAAFKNDLDAVRQLAFVSTDVNATDKLINANALAFAVERGNREMVQVLLSAGADINAKNGDERTAIMHLSESATVDLVRDLFAAGADVNARDEWGGTALMDAASSCKFAVVKELIADGANIDAKSKNGRTVLMSAAENDDPKVVALLLKTGVDVSARNENEESALIIAAKKGKAGAVKALIEAHAEIEAKDSAGKTALFYAVANEDPNVAKALIEAGANVNLKNDEGDTPLLIAAEDGKPDTVKALIDAGADVDAKDSDGQTALMRTSEAETVLFLLNAHADVTIKDKDGQTALSLARKANQEDIVMLLISRGARE